MWLPKKEERRLLDLSNYRFSWWRHKYSIDKLGVKDIQVNNNDKRKRKTKS